MANKNSLKESAKFVRLRNGAVFRRTPLLEKARGAHLITDDEARDYFEERGADFRKLESGKADKRSELIGSKTGDENEYEEDNENLPKSKGRKDEYKQDNKNLPKSKGKGDELAEDRKHLDDSTDDDLFKAVMDDK